jgi:hypothetical protein
MLRGEYDMRKQLCVLATIFTLPVASAAQQYERPVPAVWMPLLIAEWVDQHGPQGIETIWLMPEKIPSMEGKLPHRELWSAADVAPITAFRSGEWKMVSPGCLTMDKTLVACGLERSDVALALGEPVRRGETFEVTIRAIYYLSGRLDVLDGGLYRAILGRDGNLWQVHEIVRLSVY